VTRTLKTGLLLINLGTPESPRPSDVRAYLREFLMDPRVIDLPGWKRWLVVNLILISRPKASGEAYAKIWTEQGSPLLIHSVALAEKVARRLPGVPVEPAMRYGNPSIVSALGRLRQRGVDKLVVFPLYPQYSSAANGSSLDKVFTEAAKRWNVPDIETIPPFYDDPGFIGACAARARPVIESVDPEKVYFSFHGLPQRHVVKSDDSGEHCLRSADCCACIGSANRSCYRAQCYATARLLAERLGIPEEKRVVCFQSRLGRDPWIQPYTDQIMIEHARSGVKRAVILSPAFVADCLETLEELGIRAVEDWKAHGGERLEVAPCVNSDDRWVEALLDIVRRNSTAIRACEPVSAGATT
jgi:ferrochelatase